MHSYASGLTNRTRVIYGEALISIAAFFFLGLLVHLSGHSLPFYVGTPSSGLFFSLIFAAYDRYLWRARLLGLRFSRVADLNGVYAGYIVIKAGRRAQETERMRCFVRIRQSWSKISIGFETEFSRSRSSMAAIDDGGALHPHMAGLRYYYHVEPKAENSIKGMGGHSGLARLTPQTADWSVLDGDWFSDYGYHRFGPIHLERLPDDVEVNAWLSTVGEAAAAGE
jgi:hypothetical protein